MVEVPIGSRESIDTNNLRMLRLRKLEFKQHLIGIFETLGYVFITVLYLKNMSFVRFFIRLCLHVVLSNPFPSSLPRSVPRESKRNLTKSFLVTLNVVNALFFALDMITGVPETSNGSGLFHGSLTLQIIGETPPSSRWTYVYYNVLIASVQFVTLYLSCMLNTDDDIDEQSTVLPGSSYSLTQVEGDGYTGNCLVGTLHPSLVYWKIMNFSNDNQQPTDGDATTYNDYMGHRFDISQMI